MRLYHFSGSTTCRPVEMFAAEAGIALDLVPVDLLTGEHVGPGYTRKNPTQQVPTLEDGDFVLTENAAILRYLATLADSPAYPKDPKARARVDEQLDWFNTGFSREFCYGAMYPRIMPHMAFEDSAIQAAVNARCTEKGARFMRILDADMLKDPGPFLGGTAPNLADYMGVAYATLGEMARFDYSPYPRVQRWIAAMKARPGWKAGHAAWEGWRDHVLSQVAA